MMMILNFVNYKAKLLGNTKTGEDDGILKNATIAVSLKYPSSFW